MGLKDYDGNEYVRTGEIRYPEVGEYYVGIGLMVCLSCLDIVSRDLFQKEIVLPVGATIRGGANARLREAIA